MLTNVNFMPDENDPGLEKNLHQTHGTNKQEVLVTATGGGV